MSSATKRVASLAMAVVGGVLLAVVPATAHASTNTSLRPANANRCANGAVDIHRYDGTDECFPSLKGSHDMYTTNVEWVNSGNNWIAFTWANGQCVGESAPFYAPGMPPGSTWTAGGPFCIGRLDINT
ncbi:beta/gamma crystallin domain-containing protein [Streptomyces sp. NPDC056682]|uniref:beta/gamma crystallin domain-containing protein n=1 Tax=Streptomyces sp. NPDC056682 TaxID=3345909 RepID=UPI0036912C1C